MNFIYIFGTILLIIAITETILSGTWNKFYFLHGIQIYSKEIEISDLDEASKELKNYISNLDNTAGFKRYKGKVFDENTFAFRKKLVSLGFSRNDFEDIHGTITINPESRSIKIKGYTGYTILAFLLYFFFFFLSDADDILSHSIPELLFVLTWGAISYAFSRRKYNKLFAAITELLKMDNSESEEVEE